MLISFNRETEVQMKRMNATIELCQPVFFNHRQDDWMTMPLIAEWVEHNVISERKERIPFIVVEGVALPMSFEEGLDGGPDQQWCGETAELEGSEPIINTLPHLSRQSNRNPPQNAALVREA